MNLHGSTLSFPFRADFRGALATTAKRGEIIADAIADVLETRQGERPMLPDYGLPDFLFAVIDKGFAARIAYYAKQQITRYVPLVENVAVKAVADDDGRANLEIRYMEVGAFASPKNLVYPIWQLVELS